MHLMLLKMKNISSFSVSIRPRFVSNLPSTAGTTAEAYPMVTDIKGVTSVLSAY